MKNAQCKKGLNKFYEKEIYTIQQFQYRKEPSYKWSVIFFEEIGITEWDSFCEKCILFHSNESKKAYGRNLNSLLQAKKPKTMSENSENLKESVTEYSKKLAKLGMELGKIQFSYKIEEKASKEYWQHKIEEFKKHNEKGFEYYNQVHAIITLVNKEEAQMFLLHTSKFQQLSTTLIEIMEKIRENPSIIDPKDKQQSKWSKEIKNQITEHSNKCLKHEKDTNMLFRKFYEKNLKQILE